jgi:hypothetical protein
MEVNVSGGVGVISREDVNVLGGINTTMIENDVSQESRAKQESAQNQTGILDDPAVSRLYTPLSVAKEEIRKRWQNEDLKREVEKFLGVVPEVFQNGFSASLFRFIATPDLECRLAQDMASAIDLNFVFMEFLNDKFCTRNADKMRLGKMVFFKDRNKRDAEFGSRVKVINIVQSEGIAFKDIKTLKGENFVDFHHNLFRLEGDVVQTFDVSRFKTNGETASEVYRKILALFICHGILFENYFVNTSSDEKRFTHEVIIPMFDEAYERFGVKPLIVPIISSEDEDASWQAYPESLRELV